MELGDGFVSIITVSFIKTYTTMATDLGVPEWRWLVQEGFEYSIVLTCRYK